MLNFKSWNIGLISLICFLGIIYAIPNFTSFPKVNNNSFLPGKTINLGLDLQGGSYLLLEADIKSVINERLETISDDVSRKLNEYDLPYSQKKIDNGILKLYFNDNSIAERAKTVIRQNFGSELSIGSENLEITVNYSENARKQIIDLTIEQAIEIVRRRIDETGTKEPLIQRQGLQRILIQLPGIDDPERIKSLLGKTAKLTFQLVDTNSDPFEVKLSGRVPPGRKLLESYSNSDQHFVVQRRVMVSGEMLTDARSSFDQNGRPSVSFSLTPEGGKRFGRVTANNIGRPFAIILDGKVVSAPVIQAQIFSSGQITGQFSVTETKDLALLLRAGALPAPLTVMEERSVGPGLGRDSVDAGKMASIIGMILVIIFMLFTYGVFGIFANVALFINITLIISLLSVLQATLTLPGIAGIVLTMGMAVDANVLIFERIREEIRGGRSVLSSVESGYKRAIGTIVDASLTTLIASACLYGLGSGPIKGFAVTLSIGILTSMFTAIMVTRLLVVFYLRNYKPKKLII